MSLVNNQKAYDQYLLSDHAYGNIIVCEKPIGFYFNMRIPNFRGNYLSCIEKLTFTLDGEAIAPENVQFLLNNKRFSIQELPELYKEYWNVNDSACMEVNLEGGLTGKHQIGACMMLRYGYSAYFGKCKVVTSNCEKELDFGKGDAE